MADFLGVEQPTVWRLENGRDENGPEARILGALARGIAEGAVPLTASPSEALKALGLTPVTAASDSGDGA